MTRQTKITLLVLEALLLLAIMAGLRHQLAQETDAAVSRNRAIAQAIARHAADYFADLQARGGEYNLRELNSFLDTRLGRSKLFDEDAQHPRSFEVYRLEDLELGRVRPEIVGAVDFSRNYTVQRESQNITVTVPFALEAGGKYYGIVRIPTPVSRIYTALFHKNVAIYLTVGFLFVAQLILAYLVITKRRREIVFEQGYLREHALGALKLQRQILDGIIRDHEGLGGQPDSVADGMDEHVDSSGEGSDEFGNVVRLPDKSGRR